MRIVAPPKEAFPLTWPQGWPRTRFTKTHRDDPIRSISIGDGCEKVVGELRRIGATGIIISSNLRARLDGQPYSNQSQPLDCGIAVYFNLKNRSTVLACDKWDRVSRNLWAIAAHVEALRGQERWGVGSIEQAFAGYAQLPGVGESAGLSWWTELGVRPDANAETIKAAYYESAKLAHPDRGGSNDAMVRLNEAFSQAMMAQNGRNGG